MASNVGGPTAVATTGLHLPAMLTTADFMAANVSFPTAFAANSFMGLHQPETDTTADFRASDVNGSTAFATNCFTGLHHPVKDATAHFMAANVDGSIADSASSLFGLCHLINILVVDENCQLLVPVVNLLKCCGYNVTMATTASEALAVLNEDVTIPAINLVMVDAYLRHDMDVFKFIRIVTSRFNLPVIMMVHNGETTDQFVCKAIESGACQCLLRPIRLEEIKILWQHVMIRRNNSVKLCQHKPAMQMNLEQMPPSFHGNIVNRDCMRHSPLFHEKCDEQSKVVEPPPKKQRVKWSDNPHLEKKFILAVRHLGIDRATPTKILELIAEKDLSRENVSSHLQKYKLRLKKENVVNIPQASLSNSAQEVQPTNNQIISPLQPFQLPACPVVGEPPSIIQNGQQNSAMAALPMLDENQQPICENEEEWSEGACTTLIDELNRFLSSEPEQEQLLPIFGE